MAARLPEEFGKYVLVERLGAGGMAEVFKAVLRGEGGFEKHVAVKRILSVFSGEHELQTLFGDEARIVASLSHGNLCQVFDFGEIEGARYIAMELVEGSDLGHLVEGCEAAGMPFPQAAAAFVIAEAARGLDYAHERRGPDGQPLGIVHRDVSPQNLLVSYSGEVKVTDFGIAKATGKRHKTATGVVMGKIRYMSPEQILGTSPLDRRSDIFSLGVVLYELLAGGPIWPDVTPMRAAELVHTKDAPPPSTRRADVPPELDRIVALALAREPDRRYQRASELARDLSRWLSAAAPGFTREDVAALVGRVVPEKPHDVGRAATELGTPPEVRPQLAVVAPSRRDRLPTTPLRTKGMTSSEERAELGRAATIASAPPLAAREPADVPEQRVAVPIGDPPAKPRAVIVDDADEPAPAARRRRESGSDANTMADRMRGSRSTMVVIVALLAVIAASAALIVWKLTTGGGGQAPVVASDAELGDGGLGLLLVGDGGPGDDGTLAPDGALAAVPVADAAVPATALDADLGVVDDGPKVGDWFALGDVRVRVTGVQGLKIPNAPQQYRYLVSLETEPANADVRDWSFAIETLSGRQHAMDYLIEGRKVRFTLELSDRAATFVIERRLAGRVMRVRVPPQ